MSESLKQTIHLVQQAKSGESAALNLLLDRYTNRILRIVRARLGAKLCELSKTRQIEHWQQLQRKQNQSVCHWPKKLAVQ